MKNLGIYIFVAGLVLGYSTVVNAQPACKTTAECAQVAVDAAARAEAAVKTLDDRLSTLKGVVDKLGARAKVDIQNGGTPASSWAGGGTNAVDANASCPTGQVMTGIHIRLGGTCHNQCDADGRPVSSYTIVCGVPNLAQ